MIITKHYEVGITGKFQGRKFGTTLTLDTDRVEDPTDAAENLQNMCVKIVNNDIKTLAASDPNFVIIQAAAQGELDTYAKYLENAKKAESKRGTL
jgi:hypothetical protein